MIFNYSSISRFFLNSIFSFLDLICNQQSLSFELLPSATLSHILQKVRANYLSSNPGNLKWNTRKRYFKDQAAATHATSGTKILHQNFSARGHTVCHIRYTHIVVEHCFVVFISWIPNGLTLPAGVIARMSMLPWNWSGKRLKSACVSLQIKLMIPRKYIKFRIPNSPSNLTSVDNIG